MEFIAKKKRLKVTIDGQSWEIACPTIGQQDDLNERIKAASPEVVFKVYIEFFSKLGLPEEALKNLDTDEFFELTKFIFNPKKKLTEHG